MHVLGINYVSSAQICIYNFFLSLGWLLPIAPSPVDPLATLVFSVILHFLHTVPVYIQSVNYDNVAFINLPFFKHIFCYLCSVIAKWP